MKLVNLLKGISINQVIGNINLEIKGVHIDSRKTEKNHLFIAIKGTQTDGHNYINKAIENGASAILCEKKPNNIKPNITYILVNDSEEIVGKIATVFYENPTEQLDLVGVTGTNGKTTVATLLYDMFRKMGYKVGLISTVCNYIDGKAIPTDHTTPDPITLNKLLYLMANEGCKYTFMEVSSHAVAQKRVSGLKFAGGIFTNLTRDHLDYHKTIENYLKAKKSFFDNMPKGSFCLTNLDDKNGLTMIQNTKAKTIGYSLNNLCEYKGRIVESHLEGMILDINKREVATQFVGKFNASNLLAVCGAACQLGKNIDDVLVSLSTLKPVSGRFETLQSPMGYTTVIDYAHTPDALNNVLNAIHEILQGNGEIITVVGAGGNRDKGKRPLMAKQAAKLSDKVIVTSDNPRNEDPNEIISDMLEGLDLKDQNKTLSIVNRKEAIKTACLLAKKKDVILIAGKGHETYQEINGVKHHFDDKEVVLNIYSQKN